NNNSSQYQRYRLSNQPYSLYELAPANHDFAHARLPAIWIECRMASPYKCRPSYSVGDAPCSCAATDDPRGVAQRFCCSGVRNSSVACRIGCLDCRTKGCAERCLLHANTAGLRVLRAFTWGQPLSGRDICVRLWTHV